MPNEALKFHPVPLTTGNGDRRQESFNRFDGVLWVLDANGKLQRRSVRLGLKGDSSTEIVDGDIKPGDLVALRAKSGSAAK